MDWSASVKISRANLRIQELSDQNMIFFREVLKGQRRAQKNKNLHFDLYVKHLISWLRTNFTELATSLDECVFNMHSALDHCAYTISNSLALGLPNRDIYFPIRRTETEVRNTEFFKKLSAKDAEAAQFIIELQPWATEDVGLWDIREISNISKHREFPIGMIYLRPSISLDLESQRLIGRSLSEDPDPTESLLFGSSLRFDFDKPHSRKLFLEGLPIVRFNDSLPVLSSKTDIFQVMLELTQKCRKTLETTQAILLRHGIGMS